MRPVWLDGLTATGKWPRLLGSLAVSVVVHCSVLSFTGLTDFKLLSQEDAEHPVRLIANLLLTQPHAQPQFQHQAATESTSRAVVAPTKTSGAATQPEPKQTGAPGTASATPPVAVVSTPSGLLPGPWYYAARYLHRHPTPLRPIRPAYPPEAQNLSGQVVLLLLVNERGTVDSYQIIESQPPGRFDAPVVEAFTHETYAPGLITGYPVKSQLLIEVVFEPGALPETSILPGFPQYEIKAGSIPSAREN